MTNSIFVNFCQILSKLTNRTKCQHHVLFMPKFVKVDQMYQKITNLTKLTEISKKKPSRIQNTLKYIQIQNPTIAEPQIEKTGVTTVKSLIWPVPVHGSLLIKASPALRSFKEQCSKKRFMHPANAPAKPVRWELMAANISPETSLLNFI